MTVANIAKFASETIFLIHYNIWKFWMRFKTNQKNKINNNLTADKNDGATDDIGQIFADSEDEQVKKNFFILLNIIKKL